MTNLIMLNSYFAYVLIGLVQLACCSDVLHFTLVASRVTSASAVSRARWRSSTRLHATWLREEHVESIVGERHWMVDTDDIQGFRIRSSSSQRAEDLHRGASVLSRDLEATSGDDVYLQLYTAQRNFVATLPFPDPTLEDPSATPTKFWRDIRVLTIFPPKTHFHEGDLVQLSFSVSSPVPLDMETSHFRCESQHMQEDMTFNKGFVYAGYMDGEGSSLNMPQGVSVNTFINKTEEGITYAVEINIDQARNELVGEYSCVLNINGSDTKVMTGTWLLPDGEVSVYGEGKSRLECRVASNILYGSDQYVIMPQGEPNMMYCYLFSRRLPSEISLYHDGVLVPTSSPVVTSLHVFDSVRFSYFFSQINRKHSGNYTWVFSARGIESATQVLNVLVQP